jgi:hypothetical protein
MMHGVAPLRKRRDYLVGTAADGAVVCGGSLGAGRESLNQRPTTSMQTNGDAIHNN